MTTPTLVDDVNSILAEYLQYLKKLEEFGPNVGIGRFSPSDHVSYLPAPDGHGIIVCGPEATKCLERLSNAAIKSSDAYGSIVIHKVFNALKDVIVRRFIKEARTVDVSQVQKALSAAVKEAKKSRYDTTHFIPCRLASTSEPSHFRVGPVMFRPLPGFYARIEPHLNARANQDGAGIRLGMDDRSRIKSYFGTFNWVGEVTVLNCDDETSNQRAQRAVTAAVDTLRVIFGAGHTERLIAGGPALSGDDRRTRVEIDSNNKLFLGGSWSATQPLSLTHNWKALLSQSHVRFLLESGGRVIESIIDPSTDRPFKTRLVNAMTWYGQAVVEEFDAARIVKAITGLEYLVADDKTDIAATVSNRCAAIAFQIRS